MKNKESFLKELQSRLAVLEEAEQQDILAEYAQHIDLRVDGGLTEEEAIRDFGDIDQLTAEILSAYHVKPTYQVLKEKKRLPNPWPTVRRGIASAVAFFRRLGGSITAGLQGLKDRLKGWARRGGTSLDEPFFEQPESAYLVKEQPETGTVMEHTEEQKPQETVERIKKEEANEPVEHTEKKGRIWAVMGRGFRRLGHGLWRLCRAAAWLVWNLFLLLCSLPFVCLGLLALVCLGALVVLLAQGYPLAGVTLCCLGGVACCVGILGLGSGLVWHRARPAAQTTGGALAEAPALACEPAAEAEREEVTEDDTE